MADRSIHYEAAFEDYLRAKGWPYVAVDEAKKALFAGSAIKSFDFLVYSSSGPNLLTDVKGRKFPDGVTGKQRGASRAWENWITQQDVEGLREWEKVFGSGFQAVIIFAYWLQGPPSRVPFADVHFHKDKHYAFVAIPLSDYVAMAKVRSRKWQTLTVPAAMFSKHVKDVASFL